MFFGESLIFVKNKIQKPLKFFNKTELIIIENINKELTNANIIQPRLLDFIYEIFVGLFFGIIALPIIYVGFGLMDNITVYSSLLEFCDFISNDLFIQIILLFSILLNIYMFFVETYFITKEINKMKAIPCNVKEHLFKTRHIIEKYDYLKIMKHIKMNDDNLYGLFLLHFVLYGINNDSIKKYDNYFESKCLSIFRNFP